MAGQTSHLKKFANSFLTEFGQGCITRARYTHDMSTASLKQNNAPRIHKTIALSGVAIRKGKKLARKDNRNFSNMLESLISAAYDLEFSKTKNANGNGTRTAMARAA